MDDDASWFDSLFGTDQPEQLSGPVDNVVDVGSADPVPIPDTATDLGAGSWGSAIAKGASYLADLGKTAAQFYSTRAGVDIAKTQSQSAADVARLNAARAKGSPATASTSTTSAPIAGISKNTLLLAGVGIVAFLALNKR